MIAIMKTMRVSTLTMHTTMSGLMNQMDETSKDAAVMGQTFDAAKNDDSFFLPPEVFQNPDFQKAMTSFIPDGERSSAFPSFPANGDPQSQEGIERVEQIRTAAEEALKGTPLASGKIYIAGAAATAKDWQDGSGSRPVDRGDRRDLPGVPHHAVHHPKLHRRPGDRRDRTWCCPWVRRRLVGAAVAVHPGNPSALDGAGDVGDHPVGGRFGLQPATGVACARRSAPASIPASSG